MINFQYDLEEIVQMPGVGPLTLRSALGRMPGRVNALSVLYREQGKQPSLFDAAQIEDLLVEHRKDLEAGLPPGHRTADTQDFRTNIVISSTGILEALANGAKLYRDGGKVELRFVNGAVTDVPNSIFDGLVQEKRIVAQGSSGGFYSLA